MITVLKYETGFAMCTNAKGVSDTTEERGFPLSITEVHSAEELANASYHEGDDRVAHDEFCAGVWKAFVEGIPYSLINIEKA
jgi:hypothetical protein